MRGGGGGPGCHGRQVPMIQLNRGVMPEQPPSPPCRSSVQEHACAARCLLPANDGQTGRAFPAALVASSPADTSASISVSGLCKRCNTIILIILDLLIGRGPVRKFDALR